MYVLPHAEIERAERPPKAQTSHCKTFRNISVLEEVSLVYFNSHAPHHVLQISLQLICLEEEIANEIASQDYPLTPAGKYVYIYLD